MTLYSIPPFPLNSTLDFFNLYYLRDSQYPACIDFIAYSAQFGPYYINALKNFNGKLLYQAVPDTDLKFNPQNVNVTCYSVLNISEGFFYLYGESSDPAKRFQTLTSSWLYGDLNGSLVNLTIPPLIGIICNFLAFIKLKNLWQI